MTISERYGLKLGYVALSTRDVERTCAFFEIGFGAIRQVVEIDGKDATFYPIGEAGVVILAEGDERLDGDGKTGVNHIALEASDPEKVIAALGITTDIEGGNLIGAPYYTLDASATCGIRTRICGLFDVSRPANGQVDRIDHLGIASADNDNGIKVFVDKLGFPIESTQTDTEVEIRIESFTSAKYGVVTHTRKPVLVGGLHDVFITIGDCELEFLEDFTPEYGYEAGIGRGPGNTRGDQSAIGKFVQRRGPGLHHIAFKVPDINSALEKLDGEFSLIDKVGRPGGRASLIGFVHPQSFGGGLVMHLVEREMLDD